jgi:hypothetical protein
MDTEHKIKKTADKIIEKTSKLEKKATKAVGNAKAKIQAKVKKIYQVTHLLQRQEILLARLLAQ